MDQSGCTSHHGGSGSRSGGQGDFLGLRDYRVGDSIRHVHWAHTARLDSLVVCERAAAEQSPWQVWLNVDADATGASALRLSSEATGASALRFSRENLAWRVRVAASLCTLLHQQSISFQLVIPGEDQWAQPSTRAWEGNRLAHATQRLTDVPLDGRLVEVGANSWEAVGQSACCLVIDRVENRDPCLVRLRMMRAASNWRQTVEPFEAIIDLDQPIAMQINAWLQRISHGRQAA